MVLVRAVPELGTAALGVLVIHKIFPVPVAKMVVLGLWRDPVGLRAESLSVHPKALLPETIRVLDPLMYIPMLKAGVPVVILSIFPLMYPVIAVFVPPTNPVKLETCEIVDPVISMFVGFVICP